MDKLVNLVKSEYGFEWLKVVKKLNMPHRPLAVKLDSPRGFVVAKVSGAKSTDQLKKNLHILDHLERYEFPSPRLVRTRSGSDFSRFDQRYVFVYEYIEGKNPQEIDDFYAKLGELMARLHNLPVGRYPYHSRWASLENELVKIRRSLAKLTQPAERDIANQLISDIDNFPVFHELPLSLVHTDVWRGNIIENQNGDWNLIDLDHAGKSASILDLGFVISLTCAPANDDETEIIWQPEAAQALLEAYQKIRPLTYQEKVLLVAAARFAALLGIIDQATRSLHMIDYLRYQIVSREVPRLTIEPLLSRPRIEYSLEMVETHEEIIRED